MGMLGRFDASFRPMLCFNSLSREPTCTAPFGEYNPHATTVSSLLPRRFKRCTVLAVPRRMDSRDGNSNRHAILCSREFRYTTLCHNWSPPWPGCLSIRHGSALSTYTVACHNCIFPW